jgi:hypothetical protein
MVIISIYLDASGLNFLHAKFYQERKKLITHRLVHIRMKRSKTANVTFYPINIFCFKIKIYLKEIVMD